MKTKNFLAVVMLGTTMFSFSQNTFPGTGNAGIGTTTPTDALQIAWGNLVLPYYNTSPSPSGNLYLGGKPTSGANGIRMTYVSSNTTGYFDVRASDPNGGLSFRVDASSGGTERMRILPTGNIGINTASPLAKLHVHNGALRLTGTVTGMGGPQIIWGNGSSSPDNGQWSLEYTTAGGLPGLNFWRPWPTSNSGNNFLFLSDNGRVGIKTNNPTADFSVNGNVLIGDPATALPAGYKLYVQTGILTEKVKVAVATSADWADYVFADDYKLKSLDEVEKYIKENKHLPGVESAEEISKTGIDVAKTDAKLLEKIEELTLYVIQLKKEMEMLKAKSAKN